MNFNLLEDRLHESAESEISSSNSLALNGITAAPIAIPRSVAILTQVDGSCSSIRLTVTIEPRRRLRRRYGGSCTGLVFRAGVARTELE